MPCLHPPTPRENSQNVLFVCTSIDAKEKVEIRAL
ncbi:unnamed protein product [Ixodes pacificus]